jgi:hypothetical protein
LSPEVGRRLQPPVLASAATVERFKTLHVRCYSERAASQCRESADECFGLIVGAGLIKDVTSFKRDEAVDHTDPL